MITRDQFIRGFSAIEQHYASRSEIEDAMARAGWQDASMGTDPIAAELRHQLEERCNDTDDDPLVGTYISYALHEKGRCTDKSGLVSLVLDSAEALWTWWERTGTGPFVPAPATVARLDDYRKPQ